MKRFVKIGDRVWWNEIVGYKDKQNSIRQSPIYETFSGYYLASYTLGEKEVNIVSLNSITSCVVRHLSNEEMFFDEEKALKELVKKNKGEIQ